MKKRYTLMLASLGIGGVILLQSYSGGPAASGAGATGAPGDGPNTCITCHSGGSFATSLTMTLLDEGMPVVEYIPGLTYTLEVQVDATAGMPDGYGFQVVCLTDGDDSNVSGWSNPSSNAQLSEHNGRNYVEHSMSSNTGTFLVDWTAPAAGTGDLTFYGAGNAVNGNGTTAGDSPVFGELNIAEVTDTTASIGEVDQLRFSVFPNPANHSINISSRVERSQVEVLDVNGRILKMETIGRYHTIDLSDLESGIYFIRMEGEEKAQRVLKL